jgi:Flp pilus assembly protein TadG
MRRLRRFRRRFGEGERGNASLEFITTGIVLLLPMVYLILVMASIQGGALAAESAARQAARVYVQAPTEEQAALEAQEAAAFALADYDIDTSELSLAISCEPHPRACLTRRGNVTVEVRVTVPLPLVPRAFRDAVPLSVPVRSTATVQVSRFWGSR